MASRFRVVPTALYLCDNGRCYCGEHLGASARFTGHDISGQPIHRITPSDLAYMAAHLPEEYNDPNLLKCESCGRLT